MTGATLPAAAARVEQALRAAACDAVVREMLASTRTAEEAAAACGCALGAIVKSLVFRAEGSDRVMLVLTSGTNRVHAKRLGRALGTTLQRADAECVRQTTGFAIGGVPPVAHATEPVVVMDRDLMAFETVWAAAGTPRAVFPIAPGMLLSITGAALHDVT